MNIITGDAKTGADKFARDLAAELHIVPKVIQAKWKENGKYNKAAGMMRNGDILAPADIVIAFWDGESKGTLDSIKKAIKLKKELHVIRFENEVEEEIQIDDARKD
jgi:hypothetical protein